MDIANYFSQQINELKKLSYSFYEGVSRGNEPITYTTKRGEAEIQVEVNVNQDNNQLIITFDMDTNWGGKWNKTNRAKTYELLPNNNWVESNIL